MNENFSRKIARGGCILPAAVKKSDEDEISAKN